MIEWIISLGIPWWLWLTVFSMLFLIFSDGIETGMGILMMLFCMIFLPCYLMITLDSIMGLILGFMVGGLVGLTYGVITDKSRLKY